VPSRAGQLIAGRYRLLGLIDKGGQGHVYRAVDQVDGQELAIKVLTDQGAKDPTFRERMFREARALASLTGTAAVRVLDQRWSDDGALCLVMELLHGMDFEDYLRRLEAEGKRLTPSQLVLLIEPIVHTLEVAHDRGILHRDLKPANIFVLEGGGVRLVDFGFAKFVRERRFTADGFIAGSPSYIAPEIWLDAKHVDHRIDVYSLAAVIFRALGGTPPFASKDLVEVLKLATRAARPSLRALRPELRSAVDDWVEHALAIDPNERFQRVRAMWTALRTSLAI
jgi:eukaryotic-like serine/threonine-protein kinase